MRSLKFFGWVTQIGGGNFFRARVCGNKIIPPKKYNAGQGPPQL